MPHPKNKFKELVIYRLLHKRSQIKQAPQKPEQRLWGALLVTMSLFLGMNMCLVGSGELWCVHGTPYALLKKDGHLSAPQNKATVF
jgi:hypothetical protein